MILNMVNKIGIYLFLLFSCHLYANDTITQPPQDFTPPLLTEQAFQVFPISSEFQIGKIKPIVERAPQGIYLTVGSERGFRAASMTPQITYLWLLDIADPIIKFNLINRELLKAPTRQAYLHLRWDAPFTEWQKISSTLTLKEYQWWDKYVRDINSMKYKLPEYLNKYHHSAPCFRKNRTDIEKKIDIGEIVDYKTGNYLFYDDLYQHLHQLAIQNKIFVSKIDLKNPESVKQLIDYLDKENFTIGVLDLDNLYHPDYIGQHAFRRLVNALIPKGKNDSILIVMSNYKNYACGQFQFYLGYTFDNVKQWKPQFNMQNYIDSFPKDIMDIINGRLYEKNDSLPCFSQYCLISKDL